MSAQLVFRPFVLPEGNLVLASVSICWISSKPVSSSCTNWRIASRLLVIESESAEPMKVFSFRAKAWPLAIRSSKSMAARSGCLVGFSKSQFLCSSLANGNRSLVGLMPSASLINSVRDHSGFNRSESKNFSNLSINSTWLEISSRTSKFGGNLASMECSVRRRRAKRWSVEIAASSSFVSDRSNFSRVVGSEEVAKSSSRRDLIRCRSSAAALLVKVMTATSSSDTSEEVTRLMTLPTKASVFPQPAPASTNKVLS